MEALIDGVITCNCSKAVAPWLLLRRIINIAAELFLRRARDQCGVKIAKQLCLRLGVKIAMQLKLRANGYTQTASFCWKFNILISL